MPEAFNKILQQDWWHLFANKNASLKEAYDSIRKWTGEEEKHSSRHRSERGPRRKGGQATGGRRSSHPIMDPGKIIRR